MRDPPPTAYLQQRGRPGAVAQVLDDGDVAAQAPVHAAALVTHQHAPADGGPAGVCREGARVGRGQIRGRVSRAPALGQHYAAPFPPSAARSPRSWERHTGTDEEAGMRGRRDFPKGAQQVTDGCASSYPSLPVWGVGGWSPGPTQQAHLPVLQPFPGNKIAGPALPQGGRSPHGDMTLLLPARQPWHSSCVWAVPHPSCSQASVGPTDPPA